MDLESCFSLAGGLPPVAETGMEGDDGGIHGDDSAEASEDAGEDAAPCSCALDELVEEPLNELAESSVEASVEGGSGETLPGPSLVGAPHKRPGDGASRG